MLGLRTNNRKARILAFYLPQFHPVPENDEWWGKGFTEWTNVTRAKPLFRGHKQPKLPADLGYYDLRVPETRQAQADLAREHGIEGFCYWHYWFSGKRLLQRPFTEVLSSGKPDFPFCLAWANASWSGIWHGNPDRTLIKQEYPGTADHRAHFESIAAAFSDSRYLTVDGKPIFVIFRPHDLPDSEEFTNTWRKLAEEHGLPGLYLVGIGPHSWNPTNFGYDAVCVDYFSTVRDRIKPIHPELLPEAQTNQPLEGPCVYDYQDIIKNAFHSDTYTNFQHPCIIPNWDNTPRSKRHGVVYQNCSPALFASHLENAIELIRDQTAETKLLFLKSWNEWAEGNYVEPDQQFGDEHLLAIKDTLKW